MTDAGSGVTSFTYDSVDNLLSLTDPVYNTTTWTYDALNRVLTDTNQLGNSRSIVYDALGNLIERTDRNGQVREFDYDLLSRLTEERWVEGATVVNTLQFNYDAASQLLAANDNSSAYGYTYDLLGRRTSTDNLGTAGAPNVVLSSAYDALGNRTTLSATIDGLADFENTYAYDALSRMTSVEQRSTGSLPVTDKRVDFSYNALGQFTSIDRYEDLTATNLVATTYSYDTLGRLTNLDHVGAVAGSPDPATLAFYTWTYDSAHRLTQVSSIDGTTDYSYDATGQLIGADYEAGAGLPTAPPDESYTYDANGNRVMGDYVIGANNLVLSDGTSDYDYDAENNLIRKTNIATGDYIDYSWDHGGRMTSVEFRDSAGTLTKHVNYTYDVFNRRIGKQVDDNGDGTFDRAERYVYDDSGKFDPGTGVPLDDIVLVFDDSGSLTNRYLHGPAIDQVLADEQLVDDVVDEVLWSLPDHLGTVRDWAAYDAALSETTVSNHLTFDSFGAITSQTDPDAEPLYAFTGREWDADAGLYYYRARWYTPDLGRFASDDPLGFGAGDTNVQRYVGNSVSNKVDPSGLQTLPPKAPISYLIDGEGVVLPPTTADPTYTETAYELWNNEAADLKAFTGQLAAKIEVLDRAREIKPLRVIRPTIFDVQWTRYQTLGGNGRYATVSQLPKGFLVGMDGADTCVGLILRPLDSAGRPVAPSPNRPIRIFHFSPDDHNVIATLRSFGGLNGNYGAILAGFADQGSDRDNSDSVMALVAVKNGLNKFGVSQVVRVKATGAYVSASGNVYISQAQQTVGYVGQ